MTKIDSISAIVSEYLIEADDLVHTGAKYVGIPCGLESIDEQMLGYNRSTLNIIGSRPSIDQTAIVEAMMYNMSVKQGLSILYISLCQTTQDIARRLIVSQTNVPFNGVKMGRFSSEQQKVVDRLLADIEGANLRIITPLKHDISSICDMIDEACVKNRVDVVFIDFLQQIIPAESGDATKYDKAMQVATALKSMAVKHELPIIMTSQLNRRSIYGDYSSSPYLAETRDCDAIEGVADSITLTFRPEHFGICSDECGNSITSRIDVNVAKNNYGVCFKTHLSYDADSFRVSQRI